MSSLCRSILRAALAGMALAGMAALASGQSQFPIFARLTRFEVTIQSACDSQQGQTSTSTQMVAETATPSITVPAQRSCGATSASANFTIAVPRLVLARVEGSFGQIQNPLLSQVQLSAEIAYPRVNATEVAIVVGAGEFGGTCQAPSSINRSFQGNSRFDISTTCSHNPRQPTFVTPPDRDTPYIGFNFFATVRPFKDPAETAQQPSLFLQVRAVYAVAPYCPFRLERIVTEGNDQPDVTVRKGGGAAVPAVVGQPLCADDVIETGIGSLAQIRFTGTDGSMNFDLEEMSIAHLRSYTSIAAIQQIRMELAIGKAAAKIAGKTFQSDFTIQTPAATAGVRGTIFSVEHNATTNTSTVSVQEGSVEVTGPGDPPAARPGLPLMLRAGEQVKVTAQSVGPVRGLPAISAGGVVDGASFRSMLVRGGIASVFGTNFATLVQAATTVPLPLTLGGVSVRVDGVRAPLFFVAPGQINFQVPSIVPLDGSAEVIVEVDGADSIAQIATLKNYAPGIFTYVRTAGVTDPIVVHLDNTLVSPQSPAARGEALVIYATGAGDLLNAPRSNQLSPLDPLATSRVNPTVTVGGQAAQVLFTGLTPGFLGLLQINIVVPAGLTGNVPLEVTFEGGARSQAGLQLEVR